MFSKGPRKKGEGLCTMCCKHLINEKEEQSDHEKY